MKIKISIKMMRLKFRPCTYSFIKDYCKGACCRSSNGKTVISIHKSEVKRIEAMGGRVVTGLLNPEFYHCMFQAKDYLCDLHLEKKPFGCIASPFTLNKKDTLIVRHRYLMFKCHSKSRKAVPAYRAHFQSLVFMFGKDKAIRIRKKLVSAREDFSVVMEDSVYNMLKDNDDIKRAQMPLITRGR